MRRAFSEWARPGRGVQEPSEPVATSSRRGRCWGSQKPVGGGPGWQGVGNVIGGTSRGTWSRGFSTGAISEFPGGDPVLRVWGALPPPTLPERGVKPGRHRERKAKDVVEQLGYVGGAPEGAAAGAHCSPGPAALTSGPLEVVGTLLGTGRVAGRPCGSRGGGLDCGGRMCPCGVKTHFEGQADGGVKTGDSLCSTRQEAGPAVAVNSSVLPVTVRLAVRIALRDCSLFGGMLGRPSQGAVCITGQAGGPGGLVSSWCSWQGVGW